MKNNEEEMYIVTEVGDFGAVNINDPTKKKIKKKNELEELINESIQENAQNLK